MKKSIRLHGAGEREIANLHREEGEEYIRDGNYRRDGIWMPERNVAKNPRVNVPTLEKMDSSEKHHLPVQPIQEENNARRHPDNPGGDHRKSG